MCTVQQIPFPLSLANLRSDGSPRANSLDEGDSVSYVLLHTQVTMFLSAPNRTQNRHRG